MSILQGAHDFVVNGNLILVDNSRAYKIGSGLKALFKASYPDAAYDSSTHPTQCYPGTRRQHIEDIIRWITTLAGERHFPMMWLQGPAGVGKSALAQSCAQECGCKLAAAFFFSRPNARDDPARLFISIAYQLATRYPSYRDKLDDKVHQDRSLLQKSIAVQFQELIVSPLQELRKERRGMAEGVIFIDGLDECAGEEEQCTIIDVIATSIRDRTTPFIWALFSRPEPRIVAQFSSPHIYPFTWQLTLPVSREVDGEIELYLRGAFGTIRTQNGIPSSVQWPSDGDIKELVNRSAGLFIYPTSITRYVSEGGALGPEEQLRQVLCHPGKSSGNPWTHLDAFYTLIMEQGPNELLPNTLRLLLLFQVVEPQCPVVAAAILGFSATTFFATLSKLHSVVKLTRSRDGLPLNVNFYHASFTDFLMDPGRSKDFYPRTPERCAVLLADVVDFFDKGVEQVTVPWHDPRLEDEVKRRFECVAFDVFWQLGSYSAFDHTLLQKLSEFDFRKILYGRKIRQEDAERLFNSIPCSWQARIMRPYSSSFSQKLLRKNKQSSFPFVLGKSDKKVIIERIGQVHIVDYEDFRRIERYNSVWKPLYGLIRKGDVFGEIEQY